MQGAISAPIAGLMRSQYWDKCYRKNADHLEAFSHPADTTGEAGPAKKAAPAKKAKPLPAGQGTLPFAKKPAVIKLVDEEPAYAPESPPKEPATAPAAAAVSPAAPAGSPADDEDVVLLGKRRREEAADSVDGVEEKKAARVATPPPPELPAPVNEGAPAPVSSAPAPAPVVPGLASGSVEEYHAVLKTQYGVPFPAGPLVVHLRAAFGRFNALGAQISSPSGPWRASCCPQTPVQRSRQAYIIPTPSDAVAVCRWQDLGVTLVGPFDVLAGKMENIDSAFVSLHLHWRFLYDPPESVPTAPMPHLMLCANSPSLPVGVCQVPHAYGGVGRCGQRRPAPAGTLGVLPRPSH